MPVAADRQPAKPRVDVTTAGNLAKQCLVGQCDLMARDLAPLVSAQRAAVAGAKLNWPNSIATWQPSKCPSPPGGPDPNLCLEEGGESHYELRMRTGLPVRNLLLTRD